MAKISCTDLISERDGLKLSVAVVLPQGEPRGLVQFVHGMAEHKERYLDLMTYLADAGFACVINDHRGHGGSVREPKDLGYFYKNGASALVDDLRQVGLWFEKQFPGKKRFLVGHSMGSLAVRAYAAKYGSDVGGVVVSGSPGYNAACGAGIFLTYVLQCFLGGHGHAKLLDGMVTGAFAKKFPEDGPFGWLSPDKDHVSAYENDPLCGFTFTVNGYRALLKLMAMAYDAKSPLPADLPMHFVSGELDPCAPDRDGFLSAVENVKKRGCQSATYKLYPNLRHEILGEVHSGSWEDLLGVLGSWSK